MTILDADVDTGGWGLSIIASLRSESIWTRNWMKCRIGKTMLVRMYTVREQRIKVLKTALKKSLGIVIGLEFVLKTTGRSVIISVMRRTEVTTEL